MRPGHHRPLGTTTRMRMEWHREWHDKRVPMLMDVAIQNPVECHRAYRVVGVEEHRDSPKVWWLVMERISWEEAMRAYNAGGSEVWWFENVNRS